MGRTVYQFGKRRAAKVTVNPRPKVKQIKEQYPEIQEVQGIMPDSKEEWWVALALNKMKVGYTFQYSISGGKRRRGGQMIDFMVYTNPLPTPIAIQGKYWHAGTGERRAESELNMVKVDRALRGRARPVVQIWDYEITSPDKTLLVIKERVL